MLNIRVTAELHRAATATPVFALRVRRVCLLVSFMFSFLPSFLPIPFLSLPPFLSPPPKCSYVLTFIHLPYVTWFVLHPLWNIKYIFTYVLCNSVLHVFLLVCSIFQFVSCLVICCLFISVHIKINYLQITRLPACLFAYNLSLWVR
jgi:hypothetical protein